MQQLHGSMDPIHQTEIFMLRQRVDALEQRSGLMSRSFLTRAFSVWGYMLVAQIIIAIVIGGGLFVLSFGMALLGGMLGAMQ